MRYFCVRFGVANLLMPFIVKFSCGGSLNIIVRLTVILIVVFFSSSCYAHLSFYEWFLIALDADIQTHRHNTHAY